MKEQEGDEPPPVAERRATRRQPRRETRTEHLEQCIDTLTELVNTLVAALGQNTANVTPAIPLGIPLAKTEGEEVPPSQEGKDVIAFKARTNADTRRKHAWRSKTMRGMHKNRETAIESHRTEHTRDSIFNRLERTIVDPNLDEEYDSDYKGSTGSGESPDLQSRLNARRAQRK